MKTSVGSAFVGAVVLLLLLGAAVAPVAAQTPVTACGNLAAQNSYILTADLNIANGAAPSPAPAGTCHENEKDKE
jgi:hypothetical protein